MYMSCVKTIGKLKNGQMAPFSDTTQNIPPLRIGEVVPRFTARSTQGVIDLADYDDRWFILFAHPADFTPVCTSELIELAKAEPDFAAIDCALIGHSVDSLYSHLAWLRAIHQLSGVKIGFPLVEDPSMEIARAYGMMGGDAADATTVRTTYFIGPRGILHASICYPLNVGRSIPEMLRLVKALQEAERTTALTPANWQPGDALLRQPEESTAKLFSDNKANDWFYSPFKDGGRDGK